MKRKLTLIIFEFDIDTQISKTLVQIVDTNKIIFNCYPGVYMYIFETTHDIYQCEEIIEELGYNYVLFDTTEKNEYFRINGNTEFIEMFIDNKNSDETFTDEQLEKYLIQKSKAFGNESLSEEEHSFLIKRLNSK